MGALCKNCRFWQPNPSGYDGHCRRRAPSASMTGHDRWSALAQWARTFHSDWCGEHEKKDDCEGVT